MVENNLAYLLVFREAQSTLVDIIVTLLPAIAAMLLENSIPVMCRSGVVRRLVRKKETKQLTFYMAGKNLQLIT